MQELAARVKRNCDISDAKSWGYYSICGLLMRLRELYVSEHALKPWQKVDNREIMDWISRKEELWKELPDEPFLEIEIDGRMFDPFDTAGINALLLEDGLVYGAGYGPHLKATFFLAELIGYERLAGGALELYTAGREHARDLSSSAAMLKGNVIFARLEANEHLIWQKYEEYKTKAGGALEMAFSHYGIGPPSGRGEDHLNMLPVVAAAELRTYVRHELGEAAETKRLGPGWAEMLIESGSQRNLIFLRAVKDVLADTSEEGMLRHICDGKNSGSLGFYIAFLSGFRKLLSRPVQEACKGFFISGEAQSWEAIASARLKTYEDVKRLAEEALGVFISKKDLTRFIEEKIKGLG